VAVVFNDAQNVLPDGESLSSRAERIRAELASLSVRRVEVQQRIQHIRHALLELVHVFGPEILVTSEQPGVSSQPLSRGGVKMIDITRRVLSQSGQWLTLYQLLDQIRGESGTALARFINPGVAVSNALRVLVRRGAVEAALNEEPVKWRWVGKTNSAKHTACRSAI
jgi:hypothetical protein